MFYILTKKSKIKIMFLKFSKIFLNYHLIFSNFLKLFIKFSKNFLRFFLNFLRFFKNFQTLLKILKLCFVQILYRFIKKFQKFLLSNFLLNVPPNQSPGDAPDIFVKLFYYKKYIFTLVRGRWYPIICCNLCLTA